MPQLFQFILLSLFLSSFFANGQSWDGMYLGVEAGWMDKSNVAEGEVENSGPQVGGKVGMTWYSQSWVGDAGVGYRFDQMENNGVEVETNAFFLEGGVRKRLGQSRWSLGPEMHILLGQDVSFSDVGTNSDDKSVSVFLGGRLMYDFYKASGRSPLRLGAQVLTDLDINDRQVTYGQFVLEWVFGDEPKKTKPQTVVVEAPKPKPALPKPVEPEPRVQINLKTAGVTFGSGSYELSPQARSVIAQFAEVLSRFSDQWRLIKIDGHTDATGSYEKNVALSRARSESVKAVFVANGIDENRIVSRGFGPDKPLVVENTREDRAKNRRVELNLISENATEEFVSELKKNLP